jgi:hypothetical protein
MTAKLDSSLAKQIMRDAGWEPLSDYVSVHTPWQSKHKVCGKKGTPRLSHIKAGRIACKHCASKSRSKKQLLDEKIAVEVFLKANLQPLQEYSGSGKRWKSKCLICKEIVFPTFDHVKARGAGCNFCAKRKSGISQRIPETLAMEIMLASNLKPLEPYTSNSTPWRSSCLVCGKVSSPTLAGVKSRNSKCRFCAKNFPLNKRKWQVRLSEKEMVMVGEFKSSILPVLCKCRVCKTERYVVLGDINWKRGGVCLVCGVKKRGLKRRVDEVKAMEVMRNALLQPLEPYVNSDTKWLSLCLKCGQKVTPKYGLIVSGQGGCPFCAEYGFNFAKPAYLYFIQHSSYKAFKVGIGNSGKIKKSDRLRRFIRQGWELIEVWNYKDGKSAAQVEQEFFRVIRKDLKIPQNLQRKHLKYGGETETFSMTLITKKECMNILNKLNKDMV